MAHQPGVGPTLIMHQVKGEHFNGLAQTELAQAQCDTIRVKLLKIGAVIRVSVRRVAVSLSEAYPLREVFVRVWEKLSALLVVQRAALNGFG